MTAKVLCPNCHNDSMNVHFYEGDGYYEIGCDECGSLISRVNKYDWKDCDNGGLKDENENKD